MIGLDTNVLLRWLIDTTIWPDDAPDQTRLVADILERRDERFFVDVIVLAEAVWVLARPLRQRKDALVRVVRRLLDASNIEIDRREVVETALSAWDAGKGDLADHLIGVMNRHAGCATTLTFDRQAAHAGYFTRLGREA